MKYYHRGLLIVLDFVCLNLLFVLVPLHLFVGARFIRIFSFLPLLNLVWYFLSKYFQLYKGILVKQSVTQYSQYFKVLFVFILLMAMMFHMSFPQEMLLTVKFAKAFPLFIFLFTLCTFANRLLFFLYRKKKRSEKVNQINTIIIGESSLAQEILGNNDFKEQLQINDFVIVHPDHIKGLTESRLEAAKRHLKIENLHNVIVADLNYSHKNYSNLIHLAGKHLIRIYFVPNFGELDLRISNIVMHEGVPLIKPLVEPLEEKDNRMFKRVFDLFFSLLVIVFILTWLTPVVALLIFIENPGPVFFLQKRSGFYNQDFWCIKFRSMKVNREADTKITTSNDHRVTKIGAILRKTSIDELPQFFNVLKGEMSVVGPRPHMLSQTALYSEITKKYMVRHFVQPGITGWAQIMGSRGEIKTQKDMEERVEKDIWYIQNWSLVFDFKIIFLTIYNIIKGDKQAY